MWPEVFVCFQSMLIDFVASIFLPVFLALFFSRSKTNFGHSSPQPNFSLVLIVFYIFLTISNFNHTIATLNKFCNKLDNNYFIKFIN